MTIDDAKKLQKGDVIYAKEMPDAKGKPSRWKVTSVKTYKRDPNRILIGLKHGLYDYAKITEYDLSFFSLSEY